MAETASFDVQRDDSADDSAEKMNEIRKKCRNGTIRVLTASAFKDAVRSGTLSPEEADVVTCGTFGVMSGTMAVLTIPVAPPGVFSRADAIFLNGVAGIPGPCPNENLGLVDCIVCATARRDEKYGGGHLFRDMVEGKKISVVVQADEKTFRNTVTIHDLPFARMILTRGAFRNYSAFVNPGDHDVNQSIFTVNGLKGSFGEASVSGCGEINPLENDPEMIFLKEGAPVLINGSLGRVIGCGTRSTPDRPNLSAAADMKQMNPEMMGGFVTAAGPECLTGVAAALPLLNDRMRKQAAASDEIITLPIADIRSRSPLGSGVYASVWQGTDKDVSASPDRCLSCTTCPPFEKCPTSAVLKKPDGFFEKTDGKKCIACGACIQNCRGGVFRGDFGRLLLNGREIPITLRQSDRRRGDFLSGQVKEMVEKNDWPF